VLGHELLKEKGDILYSFCQEKKQEKIKSLKTMS